MVGRHKFLPNIIVCSAPHPTRDDQAVPIQCRRVRGFGFVEFIDERDAEDAERHFDGTVIGGRTITVSTVSVAHSLYVISCAHICSDAAMRQLVQAYCLKRRTHTAGGLLQAGPQDTPRDGHRAWIWLQGKVSRWAAACAMCCGYTNWFPACCAL